MLPEWMVSAGCAVGVVEGVGKVRQRSGGARAGARCGQGHPSIAQDKYVAWERGESLVLLKNYKVMENGVYSR